MGRMISMVVPRSLDRIPNFPPILLTLSRIPAIPTPGRWDPVEKAVNVFAGIPHPSSDTSSITSSASLVMLIRAVLLLECLWTLDSAS